MVFMNKETGDLYELLVLSLDDSNNEVFWDNEEGVQAYRGGRLALIGGGEISEANIGEIQDHFEFLGFI